MRVVRWLCILVWQSVDVFRLVVNGVGWKSMVFTGNGFGRKLTVSTEHRWFLVLNQCKHIALYSIKVNLMRLNSVWNFNFNNYTWLNFHASIKLPQNSSKILWHSISKILSVWCHLMYDFINQMIFKYKPAMGGNVVKRITVITSKRSEAVINFNEYN